MNATLERKVRENMLGWKNTFRIAEPMDIDKVDRYQFIRTLSERVAPEWRSHIDAGLEPVQWISYLRDYFTTSDERVRITVDRQLVARDLRHRRVLSRDNETSLPRLLVIEVKCGEKDYEHARAIVSRLPLFVDRCSKFVLASTLEHGPHPSVFPL